MRTIHIIIPALNGARDFRPIPWTEFRKYEPSTATHATTPAGEAQGNAYSRVPT